MKTELFRREAVDKITSPEDLNTYVKVLSPRVWFILAGIVIATGGLVFFAIYSGFPVWELFFGNIKR